MSFQQMLKQCNIGLAVLSEIVKYLSENLFVKVICPKLKYAEVFIVSMSCMLVIASQHFIFYYIILCFIIYYYIILYNIMFYCILCYFILYSIMLHFIIFCHYILVYYFV